MRQISLGVLGLTLAAHGLSAQMGHAPAPDSSAAVTVVAADPNDSHALADAKRHYRVKVTHDDFTKSTMSEIEMMRIEKGALFFPGTKGVTCSSLDGGALMLDHHTTPGRAGGTALIFRYIGKDWIFIDKDEPLRILAGDSLRTFPVVGEPRRDVVPALGVMEAAVYPLTTEDLAWLAALPSARVRITGTNANCDFPLSAEALAIAGLFNDRVVRTP